MGATPLQIVRKSLLPGSAAGLVNAATITLIITWSVTPQWACRRRWRPRSNRLSVRLYWIQCYRDDTVLLLVVLVYLIPFIGGRINSGAVTHK